MPTTLSHAAWAIKMRTADNLMTVFDQISFQKVLPFEVAVDYLRALLNSQSIEIRNLAARGLMVYHVAPRHAADASRYQQAMASHDWDMARGSMAKYQGQIEKVQPTEAWQAQLDQERRHWLEQTPPTLSLRTVAEKDPDYVALGQLPPERAAESLSLLEKLARRYPDDWVLKVLHASVLMAGATAGGEVRLRQRSKTRPIAAKATRASAPNSNARGAWRSPWKSMKTKSAAGRGTTARWTLAFGW